MSTSGIANSFNATANYTTSGLAANGTTYAELGTAILSGMQQQANTISSASTTASNLKTYYNTQITNTTGVNLDTELANLTTYQKQLCSFGTCYQHHQFHDADADEHD